MRISLGCCAAFLIALAAFPTQAWTDLVLYDDFEAEFIDIQKWIPREDRDGLPGEAVREIHGPPGSRRLHMIYRAYGGLGSNVGGVAGRNRLVFPNPAAITTIEATVTVKEFESTGCAENADAAQARIRISGFFFLLPHPNFGGELRPVLADIRIVRFSNSTDGPGVLRVLSRLFHCNDFACFQGQIIHSVPWDTIVKGQSAKLFIQWDQTTQTFTSQRDDMVADMKTLPGAVAFPGGSRRLDIAPEVVNCFDAPRSVSYTEAFFDNVRVNP
ncbi:MAG: hypothetical protein L0191_10085 [Acidobacteria bacterium]|nr:hypothetical protein [Acidobacteriota bacterium]